MAAVAGATVWKGYPGCSRNSGGERWEAGVVVAQVKEDGSLDQMMMLQVRWA